MAKDDRLRPLLVGEDNPRSADPGHALHPMPAHCAGGRLAKILGMSSATYLRTFNRVNLCRARWNQDEAMWNADLLATAYGRDRGIIVLLGSKVAQAFGLTFLTPFEVVEDSEGATFVRLPHPSGRSRIWNDSGSVRAARAAMRCAIGV